MANLYYSMNGLYPEERDYVLKQLDLIKHNIYKDLDIKYSVLKSSPNSIWIKNNDINIDTALELFRLLNEVKVPNIPTNYTDYIPLDERDKPSVEIQLSSFVKFEEYNITKK